MTSILNEIDRLLILIIMLIRIIQGNKIYSFCKTHCRHLHSSFKHLSDQFETSSTCGRYFKTEEKERHGKNTGVGGYNVL